MNKTIMNVLVAGVPFGILWAAFSIIRDGAIHGFPNGVLYGILFGVLSGIIGGILFGVLFGFAMRMFAKSQAKKFQNKLPLLENERLIKEGPVSHFKKKENVGGWVYLTDKRFAFRSHSINIQKHELDILIQEIKDAEAVKTIGLIPNGLKITTIDGRTERFVVENREDWVSDILDMKMKYA